jgi:hypothetical protein
MEERRIRALRRWEQQQREWRAQEERLVERTGQPASSLAMSKQRAVEYRTNLQTKTQLMKSMPLQDKGLGPAEWYMSLRDGWTRQVQVLPWVSSPGMHCHYITQSPHLALLPCLRTHMWMCPICTVMNCLNLGF